MKINETQRIGSVNPYRKDANPNTAGGVKKKGKKDEVQISSEAQQLLNTREVERGQKVSDLKQSVSAGTYHVEAGKLAEKLAPYFD